MNAVLFDLDGTLVDTAPDLIHCLGEVLAAEGWPPAPPEAVRATVSHGAAVMVQQAFSLAPDDARTARLAQAVVERYRHSLTVRSRPFPGVAEVLSALQGAGVPWGVVTNKPAALARPLLEALDLHAAAVVCGDDLPRAKPYPDPIFAAAEELGVAPADCLTIGDARRDIEAATRAGAGALAALFGYLHAGDDPATWGAHGLIRTPEEILAWLAAPPAAAGFSRSPVRYRDASRRPAAR